MRTRLNLFIFALATTLLALPAQAATSVLAARSSSVAGVTVKITPRALDGALWTFDVVLDTHTQTLSDDLEKTVILVADGNTTPASAKWQGDPPGTLR